MQAKLSSHETLIIWLKEWIASKKKITTDDIDIENSFSSYGIDSLAAVELSESLQQFVSNKVDTTILYNYPNIKKLSDYIISLKTNTSNLDLNNINNLNKHISSNSDMAIIGIGCRFPGADNKLAFWELLKDGIDAVTVAPKYHSHYASKYEGGFLDRIDLFDAEFFNISPREAKSVDPQQRLLLEVSYAAIEDAGIKISSLANSNTGVFIGIANKEYAEIINQTEEHDFYAATGSALSIAANRLSYFYDLKGPSIAIDTACSSSLMAVHLACNSLKSGESQLAIAGGVNLLLSLATTETFDKMGFLSSDSRCKAFAATANGYVRSEGCGVVILKPLITALQDNNHVYAVIKATATNQDGHSNGITAPNQLSQEQLLNSIYSSANIVPNLIDYVECHGTGTKLGDPIEIGAINQVIGQNRTKKDKCIIGSVKTNLGHLEAASGIASLIKVALMIENKAIPASLHFREPNPNIDFVNIPFLVQTKFELWQAKTMLCGINSFSFGGSNVHAILSSHVQNKATTVKSPQQKYNLLLISAKNLAALKDVSLIWQRYLDNKPTAELSSICGTAIYNRECYPYRYVAVGSTKNELIASLVNMNQVKKCKAFPKIGFIFTGQGAQFSGMARKLIAEHPIFKKWLLICDSILSQYVEFSIIEVLEKEDNQELLSTSNIIQPILVAYQIALAEYLIYLGVTPLLVLGHSLGEIAAAYIAKAITLDDAIKLAFFRGKIMQKSTGNGAMLAIELKLDDVTAMLQLLNLDLDIAGINSTSSIIVSGSNEQINQLENYLINNKHNFTRLPVNYAFHSQQMEPLISELENSLDDLKPVSTDILMISTQTGFKVNTMELTHKYWANQIRNPVRFFSAMEQALENNVDILVEIGPSSVLFGYIQEIVLMINKDVEIVRANKKNSDESLAFYKLIAKLHETGVAIAWDKIYKKEQSSLDIPHYPWQKKSYWITNKFENTTNPRKELIMVDDSKALVINKAKNILSKLMSIDVHNIDVHKPFIELGADSIIIVNAIKKIETEFSVKIALKRLFEDLQTVDKLATYINEHNDNVKIDQNLSLSEETVKAMPLLSNSSIKKISLEPVDTNMKHVIKTSSDSLNQVNLVGMEYLFNQQLQIMRQQLSLLSNNNGDTNDYLSDVINNPASSNVTTANICTLDQSEDKVLQVSRVKAKDNNSWQHRKVNTTSGSSFTPQQQEHLQKLILTYNKKTAKSKELVQKYRNVLADSKASVGFRLSIKEMLYPIVGNKTLASKMWDIDGNEYVDITMGFGVHLCGYNPKFLQDALLQESESGIQLGPRSYIVGETAALIAEITGHERVAFSNTGTEAITTAIRIARTYTGKEKIVIFNGAYHGHSDYSLVEAYTSDNNGNNIPITPGIPKNILDNTIVLEYGEMSELEQIIKNQHDIAAVLVEPVQSKRPEFQPIEFLKALRKLTYDLNIILIFDEMVTGFRANIAGAQGFFGIKADMATYGKIIGGGLPLGVITGSSKYMDHIDGGTWQYGDNSYPDVERTFFGGTFCQHPTSLATAFAILKYLKQEGNNLQLALNQKTANLANELNRFFIEEHLPIEVVYFASLFRFKFQGNFDLLFYHMLIHGVYVWEWRNCFLSTAHTDEDIAKIISAVKKSIYEMQMGGFINKSPN